MGNYENIREYAEFSHKAAPHGGPEHYLEEYGNARYERGREIGREEQKEEDQLKIAFAGAAVVCAVALIGLGKQKLNEFKQKKAQKRAEQAKEACLRAIAEEKAQTETDAVDSNKEEE